MTDLETKNMASDRVTHEPSPDAWWHCPHEDSEVLHGPEETRDAAIQAGSIDYDGDYFFVVPANFQSYRADIFDADFVADQFNDHNDELGPEDGASRDWTSGQKRDLEKSLEATLAAWLERHGHARAWALDTGAYEEIPAQAMETREGGDATQAPCESMTARSSDAPKPQENPHG